MKLVCLNFDNNFWDQFESSRKRSYGSLFQTFEKDWITHLGSKKSLIKHYHNKITSLEWSNSPRKLIGMGGGQKDSWNFTL